MTLLLTDLSECPVCKTHGNGCYVKNFQNTDLVHLECRDGTPVSSTEPVPEVSP